MLLYKDLLVSLYLNVLVIIFKAFNGHALNGYPPCADNLNLSKARATIVFFFIVHLLIIVDNTYRDDYRPT